MLRTADLRCRFRSAVEGTLAGFPVRVTELGRYSALLEHEMLAIPGKRKYLSFRAGGEIFLIASDVARSRVDRQRSIQEGRLVYRTEVDFGDLDESTARHLDDLLQVLQLDENSVGHAHTEALQFEIVSL